MIRHKTLFRLMFVLLTIIILMLVSFSPAAAAPPVNDDFDGSSVIPGLPFPDFLDTSEATTAVDDPDCVGQGPTVWYSFTPTEDVRIEANTFVSDYDTTLSVYTGSRGALTQIACNDDMSSLQSQVIFYAIAGETYFFMVGAFASGPGGNLVFSVNLAPPPPINNPPTADAGGPYLVRTDSTISLDGTGSDPDQDLLTYSWTATAGSFDDSSLDDPAYTAGSEAGIYELTLTVTDSGGLIDQDTTIVVVYDSGGGFVTGGGWFDSPEGAYTPGPMLTGKATFGFVSKYKKGASVPTGNTEFQFKAADLNFHSSDYEWLVVNQGGTNAQFKGTGTINGAGSYKFMLWAGDDEPDTFRIKIWWEDGNEVEHVIYDNGPDQAIGGGNIVVHTKKS